MCVPGPHPGYTKSELLRLVPSTKHPRSASQTSVCIWTTLASRQTAASDSVPLIAVQFILLPGDVNAAGSQTTLSGARLYMTITLKFENYYC